MTRSMLTLRHLCFTGPEKAPARVGFEAGLNVIYGASDTGKSFVLEAIDFMLGGRKPLRDIPERVGYNRIFLGVEAREQGAFTLSRATNGGSFHLYEGLHETVPEGVVATVLGAAHNAAKTTNISRFLLDKVGLDRRRVRKNAGNETRDLSFRDLCHLCLVTEGDIQKQESPIETGQVIHKTVEYSIFKLLLTGVDDSAVVTPAREAAASQSRAAKLEVMDELIASVQARLEEAGEDEQELVTQLERLTASIDRDQHALRSSEVQYQALLARRNQLRKSLENGIERRGEIDELAARFQLLDQHYQSDLARLEAIREAGSLMAALAPHICPLCGASPEEQHRDTACDGNLENVVAAAEAESAKIVRLRRELAETVRQLGHEARSFDRVLPRMTEEREKIELEIQEARPGLTELRSSYSERVEERAAVHSSLAVFAQLTDLQARRKHLERGPEGDATTAEAATDLSSTTLDLFAQQVEKLLDVWKFPEGDRVQFAETDRDLIIHGKRRGSRGKGLRAITHAAFTVGILEFCKQHPGFVVLDSPLLAYRAPEGPEDDLTGTDVQDKFYEYLAGTTERQVIILENTTPPAAIAARPDTNFFSKNPHQGRYGFFPLQAAHPEETS
jgi:chromosome segregation ATPase